MANPTGHRPTSEEQLDEYKEYTHLLVENLKDYAVLTVSLQGNIIQWNSGALEILGYMASEIAELPISEIFRSKDREAGVPERELKTAREEGKASDIRWHLRKDGSLFWAEGVIVALNDKRGTLKGYSKFFQDTTERKLMEEALRRSEEQHRLMMENIKDYAIYLLDKEGNIATWNQGAEHIYGYSDAEVLGKYFGIFYTAEDIESEQPKREMQRAQKDGRAENEYWRVRKDGSQFWGNEIVNSYSDENGNVQGFVKVIRDITEKKRDEETIRHQALHDPLTDLPNRALGEERLLQAIGLAERSKKMVAAMLLDLDRFKNVNDTLGHPTGDLLLKEVAVRLQQSVSGGDTVVRLGGDEFLILLPELEAREELEKVVKKIFRILKPEIIADGHELHINTSIGIALYPEDGRTVETLVKHADTALYHAKELGRNTYQLYTGAMHHLASQRLTLENSLRNAITYNQFILHYQPIVDLQSKETVRLEALLRWQHPERGLVYPDEFMPLAEEVGLILPIGTWVIEAICKQVRRWHRAGHAFGQVSFNLSGRQFAEPQLCNKMAAILKRRKVDPHCLQIEITETSAMQNIAESISKRRVLKDMGMQIAIDDFGTGYSSFSYLQQIPIDQIKIDRSFIRNCLTNSRDAVIVKAIVAMAHTLELGVCAEGIETKEQLDFLSSIGCDTAQGFFISPPVAVEELV